jgi:hypothetical protein
VDYPQKSQAKFFNSEGFEAKHAWHEPSSFNPTIDDFKRILIFKEIILKSWHTPPAAIEVKP